MIRYLKIRWAGLLVSIMMAVYRMGYGTPAERAEAMQLQAEYERKIHAK